jgi:arylsulfatase A-like enzyme
VEYYVKIPERSFFEFGIFTPDSPGDQLIMKVKISIEDRDLFDKEFVCEKRGHLQSEQIDLSGWGGKEAKFSFSAGSLSDTSIDTMRAILLVNPVIRRARKSEEKNILFIMLDTLRADHLGCYGYYRDTSPHIDKFAKEALLFQNAFSQSSWTLPSHYSIFTSLYPYESGYTPVYNPELKSTSSPSLPPEIDTLTEWLKEAGYLTLATTGGGYMNSAYGLDQGFEEYWDNFYNKGREILVSTERVNNWIGKNKHLKWFVFFHTYEIHDPYDRSFFKGNTANGEADNVIARYDSGIRYADKYVGQIIEKLRSTGLLENTVVIITSDHGESFYRHDEPARKEKRGSGRHGHNLYDNLIRVPLIIGGMGNMRQKRVIGNVELTDLMPTILDLAGVQSPENIRGRSLVRFSRGERMKKKNAYSEAIEGPIEIEMKSLRSDIHKLIYNANPSKPEYEFYNIKEDPLEMKNLSGKGVAIKDIFVRKLKMLQKSIQKGRKKLLISSRDPAASDDLIKQLKALGYIGE